jgi:hypothetical protein
MRTYASYRDIGGPGGHLAHLRSFRGHSLSAAWEGEVYKVRSYRTVVAEVREHAGQHLVDVSPIFHPVTTSRGQVLAGVWAARALGARTVYWDTRAGHGWRPEDVAAEPFHLRQLIVAACEAGPRTGCGSVSPTTAVGGLCGHFGVAEAGRLSSPLSADDDGPGAADFAFRSQGMVHWPR